MFAGIYDFLVFINIFYGGDLCMYPKYSVQLDRIKWGPNVIKEVASTR